MLLNRKFWLSLSAALVAVGLVGISMIFIKGEHVMGTNDYVAWGSLIAGYVFFVVAGTGLSLIGSLGHVFGIKQFNVIGKRAVLGAIILIVMGFVVILTELGKPLNMVHILFTPNFKSAIFWMGVSYGLYIVLLLAEFFLMVKNNHTVSRIVGIFVLIVALFAYGNLGNVFGYVVARPFWTGPYQSIFLITSAFMIGAAILSIMFYIFDKVNKTEKLVHNGTHLVSSLGKLMALFIGILMFFTTFKMLSSAYMSTTELGAATWTLINGPLAPYFWIFEVGFAMVIPFAILMTKGGFQPKRVLAASFFVIIGTFVMRLNMIFAGQIIPIEVVDGAVEASYRTFSISLAEGAVMLGALGGAILLYLIGEKLFNLNMSDDEKAEKKAKKEQLQSARS